MEISFGVLVFSFFSVCFFFGWLFGWAYKRLARKPKRWPKDIVIVHDVGPGPRGPSLSIFPLKLQTFLRMAGIPYMVDFSSGFSSKGKIPWITFNGQQIADSQFCVDFCKSHFNVRLNSQLTDEQRAIGRAFRKMAEEELYWTMCSITFGDDLSEVERLLPYKGIKGYVTPRLLKFFIWRQMRGHGIGRHTPQEILSIGYADLKSLSDFLGQKLFFFGDEPCEEDCALFGTIAQIMCHMNGSPHQTWLKDEFTNLRDYCDRMKEKFWPDWEDRTSHGDMKGTLNKIFGANANGIEVNWNAEK